MIETVDIDSKIVWQKNPKTGYAEQAVVVSPFSDVVEIKQGKHRIKLNYDSVKELIEAIKKSSAKRPK